jgi:hypothetical protein
MSYKEENFKNKLPPEFASFFAKGLRESNFNFKELYQANTRKSKKLGNN